jgi:zinc transport system substrate-binding protein
MPKMLIKKLFLFFLFIISVSSLLSFAQQDLSDSRKIKIVASVFPLMEFARAVAGERGEASLLLPPGAEAHTWQPRPSDIIRLSSARLFIFIGLNMEPWLNDFLKSVKNPQLKLLEAGQGISLLESEAQDAHHEHGQMIPDPHVWLDFEHDQVIVERIAEILSEIEPKSSSIFKKNALVYKDKLQSLDQKFREGLRNCLHRTFIIGGHSAFGYLARRYDLDQVSLYGLNPDSGPTPKMMAEAVETARKLEIKVIFFEVRIGNKLAKTLAKEIGAKLLVLNPGANLTKAELKSGKTFFDIMEKNLENLKNGLVCR